MSGGNCPETPRQKMISMMYLFLTAMLAVNVSSKVLEGFTMVDESLRVNNKVFKENNDATYAKFNAEYDKNPTKVKPWLDKANAVKREADKLNDLIWRYKVELVEANEGEGANPDSLKELSNYDIPMTIMVNELKPKGERKADTLKAAINSYREFLIQTCVVNPEKDRIIDAAIRQSLVTDAEKKPRKGDDHGDGHGDEHAEDHGGHDKHARIGWEQRMFKEIPIGAVMALMTKLQTDVRNTESMAVTHLLNQVSAKDFKVNKIDALLIPEATTVIRGTSFRAEALLAAIDSTSKPRYELFMNGVPVAVDNQTGLYEIPCNKVGSFELTGNIITKDDDGNEDFRPFNPLTFEVAEPNATVSATKMNVLYAGVENPMSISVPGFSASSIKAVFSDGSPLIKKGAGYIAKPKTPGKEIQVIVRAEVHGEMKVLGKAPFRVKPLPPPVAFIEYPKGKDKTKTKFSGGRIKKHEVLAAFGLVAELQDSDFEVNYKILSFDLATFDAMGNAKLYEAKGPKFTSEQIKVIKGKKKGATLFIKGVKAVGPDGITRRLPPVEITIG